MHEVWVPGAGRIVSALRISHRFEVGLGPRKWYIDKDDRRRKENVQCSRKEYSIIRKGKCIKYKVFRRSCKEEILKEQIESKKVKQERMRKQYYARNASVVFHLSPEILLLLLTFRNSFHYMPSVHDI